MSAAQSIYSQALLRLADDTSHHGEAQPSTHRGNANNPLCGDQLWVSLHISNHIITSARIEVRGCAIARASAAKMAQLIEGESVESAQSLVKTLAATIDPAGDLPADDRFALFSGLRLAPARRKCATLAWTALQRAVDPTSPARHK